jgi:hypothetical protein
MHAISCGEAYRIVVRQSKIHRLVSKGFAEISAQSPNPLLSLYSALRRANGITDAAFRHAADRRSIRSGPTGADRG